MDLYPDHCQVVKDSLQGRRTADEQTFASIAVLSDRLQQVRKLGERFSHIEFSPAVKHLKSHSNKVAVV